MFPNLDRVNDILTDHSCYLAPLILKVSCLLLWWGDRSNSLIDAAAVWCRNALFIQRCTVFIQINHQRTCSANWDTLRKRLVMCLPRGALGCGHGIPWIVQLGSVPNSWCSIFECISAGCISPTARTGDFSAKLWPRWNLWLVSSICWTLCARFEGFISRLFHLTRLRRGESVLQKWR